jgi:Flp pilus assembly protein CpaB
MRSRNNITIVLGIVLALLGAGVAVAATRGSNDSGSGGATTSVVVATKPITAGSAVAADALAVRPVAKNAVPADAVRSLAALAGQVALYDVSANQVVTARMFGVQAVAAAGGVQLPKGKKAIGVELGFAPGGLRYVVPGDRIDVYGSQKAGDTVRTTLLLSDVQVIATTPGAGTGAPTAVQAGTGNLDFLLAVDEAQAVKLVNAQAAQQSLYFTLSARKGAA